MGLFRNNKQFQLFTYKLFYDALFLALLFLTGLLVAEGLVPGLVGGFVSFTKVIFVIVFLILGIVYLGKRNALLFPVRDYASIFKSKVIISLLVLSVFLTANALFKFSWWEIIIGTLSAVLIFIYLLRILIEEK